MVKYRLFTALLVVILLLFVPKLSFAKSNYVLPYPSFMPGSKIYKIHLLWEQISRYWYFGNLSQFKYNLAQADKYLVESKTLFEYKQYLLGYQALKKSDDYFSNTPFYIEKAKQEGKNTKEIEEIFKQAAIKHIEVLKDMQRNVPEHFLWEPEKNSPTDLFLRESIANSISIRNKWVKP